MASVLSKAEPAFGSTTGLRMAAVGVWILLWITLSGAEMRWIDIERSTVTLYVSVLGPTPVVIAEHVIEVPIAEGSLDDTDSPHLALVINVDQLRVVDPGRSADERRRVRLHILGPEGLDAERFSRITYHSLTIDRMEEGVWLVHGELEMHGSFLPLNVSTVRRGDRFTGTTTVLPIDFGMPPVTGARESTLRGTEVRVDFDVVLEAR